MGFNYLLLRRPEGHQQSSIHASPVGSNEFHQVEEALWWSAPHALPRQGRYAYKILFSNASYFYQV